MTTKSAFTLMEVLVAVMLISVVVVGIMKISTSENRVIKHAISQAGTDGKISLFIDELKLQKDKRDIKFGDFIKNLKINSKDKKNLKDSFTYNSFVTDTLDNNEMQKDTTDKKEDMVFKIYKQTFIDKKGYSTSYYRVVRE